MTLYPHIQSLHQMTTILFHDVCSAGRILIRMRRRKRVITAVRGSCIRGVRCLVRGSGSVMTVWKMWMTKAGRFTLLYPIIPYYTFLSSTTSRIESLTMTFPSTSHFTLYSNRIHLFVITNKLILLLLIKTMKNLPIRVSVLVCV